MEVKHVSSLFPYCRPDEVRYIITHETRRLCYMNLLLLFCFIIKSQKALWLYPIFSIITVVAPEPLLVQGGYLQEHTRIILEYPIPKRTSVIVHPVTQIGE